MAQLKVTYVKSSIGYAKDQKATVASLGLRKLHQSVIHDDTPVIRGMIFKVKHLVKVEETDEARSPARPRAYAKPKLVSQPATTAAPAAQPIAAMPATKQVAPGTPASGTSGSDDLTLIEGIGPKLSGVLQSEGVTTFAQLGAMSTEDLFTLLRRNNVGRVADPDTWPEQAQLAAEGRMDDLQRLQNELKGGRRS